LLYRIYFIELYLKHKILNTNTLYKDKIVKFDSRIIIDALEEKIIKEEDPESKSRKYASYLPY
jgi:hypothetical protein